MASENPARGEITAIGDRERLAEYPFYFAAQGELELKRGAHRQAMLHFRVALSGARNPMERRYYEQRLSACD